MTSPGPAFTASRDAAVAKLAALVAIPTVSRRDPDDLDVAAFDGFLDELTVQFPLLHQHLELTRIGSHGLLFHWRGRAADRPVVLMAHLDVVPVEGDWTHPPFAAVIADGHLWGRGTLDDKGALVGICEAVERLLARDITPAQDIWLSFGCDEEVAGGDARIAAATLTERGVTPWLVLDEGGAVAEQAFPGVREPVAVVGVAEKGMLSLELRVTGDGGHASTPATWGPVTRLARALTRLEKSPFPSSLPEPTVHMLELLGAHASGPIKPLLSNASRMPRALAKALTLVGPEPAALARTTMAATTLSGSPALNVIAGRAVAGVNLRIATGSSVAATIEHVRKAIRDPRVEIAVLEAHEPTSLSPWQGPEADAFRLITRTVERQFPDAIAAPYVMMAATDSRYFHEISPSVYRHAPFRMTKQQRESIHAVDEKIGLDDLEHGIVWYQALIEGVR